jgi:hypothetical protein
MGLFVVLVIICAVRCPPGKADQTTTPPASESFVGLDSHASTAHRFKVKITHRLTDAVRQEPSRLEGAAKGPMQLMRADPFLTTAEQVHCLQPDMQRDMGTFHNSAYGHSERLAADIAFALPELGALAIHPAYANGLATARADRPVRP